MSFDPELFKKQFDEARNIAESIGVVPLEVRAVVAQQCGREILVGICPKCNTKAALAGEGKHLCHTCLSWLNYKRG